MRTPFLFPLCLAALVCGMACTDPDSSAAGGNKDVGPSEVEGDGGAGDDGDDDGTSDSGPTDNGDSGTDTDDEEPPPDCSDDPDPTSATVWLCIDGMV
jgi:hypothetical protein